MVKIEIVRDLGKKMREDNEYAEAVLAGKKKVLKTERTIVMTPEIFAKVFSPERIKLLLEVRDYDSKNIYQLAKALGRSYAAVHRDIALLEGFGVVKLKTSNKKRYPHMEAIQIPAFAKA